MKAVFDEKECLVIKPENAAEVLALKYLFEDVTDEEFQKHILVHFFIENEEPAVKN